MQALAISEKDNTARPQTYSDMAGDLRKCPVRKLEGHQNRVKRDTLTINGALIFLNWLSMNKITPVEFFCVSVNTVSELPQTLSLKYRNIHVIVC